MELKGDLFNGKGYISGITIIDLKGEILFTAKFNNKLNQEYTENYEVVGKKFLDIYENLNEDNSTTYKAMELGVPLYVENQTLKSKDRKEIKITSLSIPIKSGNKIVGAIDLSVSEDDEINNNDYVEIDYETFEKNNVDKLEYHGNYAKYVTENIITNNKKMIELKEYIKVAASCDLPTLIYGETGTGKELFAQSIHNESERKNKPFIAQNCAAIPENLLESILFGTSKGAFTGAVDNIGLLELADSGTIFLDEINSMPLHLQSKMLRVLQDGSFRSIGSKELKNVDIKIITSTNEEPLEAIRNGRLRQDLYYRLNVLNINIPPLKERKDDIPLLANFNVAKYNKVFNKNIKYISNDLYEKLTRYDWPGNIRELENVIAYGLSVVSQSKEKLEFSDIEPKYNEILELSNDEEVKVESLTKMVENYEKNIIEKTLLQVDNNVTKASKILKIPRQTLQRKVKRYNLI
ncbi:MAG: sigma 54-interacting transcriptional regulator [Clostridiaceae bacterium]|nr:sigma 54-interacting transcriptional regulator [Clostridiaceae bacterium]MBW4859374.1 sigma 54-interacting transcriptional regulator [Clostridiaceae bacterium]MBW4869382.1 sigma 54-interacting transcriptional regulator [Clostridiaceae bacterium]